MRAARLVRLFLDCVAHGGHKEIANMLIASGSDVNAADRGGQIPLHRAALSAGACGSLQPSAAPHSRRPSARTAREAAH